jgi:hypothetical protein
MLSFSLALHLRRRGLTDDRLGGNQRVSEREREKEKERKKERAKNVRELKNHRRLRSSVLLGRLSSIFSSRSQTNDSDAAKIDWEMNFLFSSILLLFSSSALLSLSLSLSSPFASIIL